MPLGIKRVRKPNVQKGDMNSRKAALRLIHFDKGLFSDKMNKKRKREKSGKAVSDKFSLNTLKNGNTLDLESDIHVDAVDSESRLTDLQDIDANTVPSKKRKRSDSTCDTSSDKSIITENKKKPRIETSKKSKATKIKLNKKSNKSIVDKSIKHKTKKAIIREVEIFDNIDQHTSTSLISNKKISSKKINNKSVAKKAISESKITHQETPLKNVNANLMLY